MAFFQLSRLYNRIQQQRHDSLSETNCFKK